jgi:hypothetical protein
VVVTRLARWIAVLAIAIGVVSTAGVTFTLYSHNEEMYIAAGALIADGLVPYRDFAYLQTPYLAWLYGAVFRLLPEPGWYLLAAKSVSLAAYAISLILVFQILRVLTHSQTGALVITAVFATHPLILTTTAEASNYAAPLALVLGAFRACLAERRRWAVAGVLMGAAIGTKLTFAPLLAPLLVAACRERPRSGLVFGAGLALGLVPLAAHLTAGLDVVAFNNVGYHVMQAQWRIEHAVGPTLTLVTKLRLAASVVVHQPSTLCVLLALAAGLVVARPLWRSPQVVAGIGLVTMSIVAALVPTPVFPQYFALPAALGILALGLVWQGPLKRAEPRALMTLTSLALASVLSITPVVWRTLPVLTERHGWTSLGMRDAGREVRRAIDAHGGLTGRPVATLSPIMALENGLPIYRELATGSFAYWPGDVLTDEERRRYVTTSPGTIGALLASRPPAAVLVGFRGPLDEPLRAYAQANGFTGPFPLANGAEYYLAR